MEIKTFEQVDATTNWKYLSRYMKCGDSRKYRGKVNRKGISHFVT